MTMFFEAGLENLSETNRQKMFCKKGVNLEHSTKPKEYDVCSFVCLPYKKDSDPGEPRMKVVFYDLNTNKIFQTIDFGLIKLFEWYCEHNTERFKFLW